MSTKGVTRESTKAEMRRVLTYIDGYWRIRGISPTIREITRGLGLSSTSVTGYLIDFLVLEGKLTHNPYQSRTYLTANQFPKRYVLVVQENNREEVIIRRYHDDQPFTYSEAVAALGYAANNYIGIGECFVVWIGYPQTGVYHEIEAFRSNWEHYRVRIVEVENERSPKGQP